MTSYPPDILVAATRDNSSVYIGKVYLYNASTLGTIQPNPLAEGTQVSLWHCS